MDGMLSQDEINALLQGMDLSEGAASKAARSSGFIVSFTFCVPLINVTFEAPRAIDCIDISPSATYHK